MWAIFVVGADLVLDESVRVGFFAGLSIGDEACVNTGDEVVEDDLYRVESTGGSPSLESRKGGKALAA